MKRQDLKQLTPAQQRDYYCNYTNLISINNNNAKTGISCLTMSFPRISCQEDVPCYNKCYCARGHQAYPSVEGAYYRNFRIYQEDPEGFEEQLIVHVKNSGLKLFRYNDCGDIPDSQFLEMMVRVAIKLPQVRFLAYTKNYKVVNDFFEAKHSLPDNLTIRVSYWDKNWKVPNPYRLPEAYIDFKDSRNNPTFPSNTVSCPNQKDKTITCSTCRLCWNKNVSSVVFQEH